jgi:hypothetical protein
MIVKEDHLFFFAEPGENLDIIPKRCVDVMDTFCARLGRIRSRWFTDGNVIRLYFHPPLGGYLENEGLTLVGLGFSPAGIIDGKGRDDRGVLWFRGPGMEHVPDLNDPATRGVILDVIRQSFPSTVIPTVVVTSGNERSWQVKVFDSVICTGQSEGQALANALIEIMLARET